MKFPKWVFCHSLNDEDCVWQWVPTKVAPACCVPPSYGRLPLVVEITGDFDSLVRSSLRKGHYLLVPELESLFAELGIPEPEGKRLKEDLAQALISSLFPESSSEDKTFMVACIMHRNPKLDKNPNTESSESAAMLLKLTATLDSNEQQHFDRMRQSAVDELAVKRLKAKANEKLQEMAASSGLKRDGSNVEHLEPPKKIAKGPGDATEELKRECGRRNIKAPDEFLQYFPLVSHCYFKWQPQHSRASVEFVQQARF